LQYSLKLLQARTTVGGHYCRDILWSTETCTTAIYSSDTIVLCKFYALLHCMHCNTLLHCMFNQLTEKGTEQADVRKEESLYCQYIIRQFTRDFQVRNTPRGR